jgi:hypothetical protein
MSVNNELTIWRQEEMRQKLAICAPVEDIGKLWAQVIFNRMINAIRRDEHARTCLICSLPNHGGAYCGRWSELL